MRKVLNLNRNWNYISDSDLNPGEKEAVTLPHSMSISPANSSGGRNRQAPVEYERRVFIPETNRGRRVLLTLEGAMGISHLWVNGQAAGEHLCGYTPFVVELTPFLHYGSENLLRLRLDNRDSPDVPPGTKQSLLDFTYEGGLYRSAWLTVTDRVYITDPLLENIPAGGGVRTWTEQVGEKHAVLGVMVHIRNQSAGDFDGQVEWVLRDAENKVCTCARQSVNLREGGSVAAETRLEVKQPHLWSPETPYLYALSVRIICDSTEIDAVSLPVGIRTFEFTCDRGILWNHQPRRISGANYHAAWPVIGNAVPENLLRRDVRRLRQIGIQNLRSHYPFCEAFLDECDRQGMTVIVSNPGWQWFREGKFAQQMEDNMRQIVRWQRNHPCVLLWEPLPNESRVPPEWQQRFHAAVKEECPDGPCYTASDSGPTDVSYRMFDPGMLNPNMERYSDVCYGQQQDRPVWIREYGDWPDNWEDQNCAWRTPRYWGDAAMLRAVERMLGDDPQCPVRTYLEMFQNKTLCGYGIWPGIEHNRGYHINPCWGGFFDLFRLPKFTAWFMDSQHDIQQAGPKLYIANWWTDVSPKDVTIFSNAERVRLYHNDTLVEERSPEDIGVAHPPFVFKNVRRFRTRDRSILTAEAIFEGKVVARRELKTPGVPRALRLEADLQGIPLRAGGSDVVAVHCFVTDRDGETVPLAGDDHLIRFTEISGCEIIGDASIGANPLYPRAGIASVLIRSKGDAVVELRAELVWPQTVEKIAVTPAVLRLDCMHEEHETAP